MPLQPLDSATPTSPDNTPSQQETMPAPPSPLYERLGWDSLDAALAATSRASESRGVALDPHQISAAHTILGSHRSGVYLVGEVGRGKTWLIDSILRNAPAATLRMHLTAFFRALTHSMHTNGHAFAQAVTDVVAANTVIFIDEFHVHDVADAVMLRRALSILAEHDIALFTISNAAPGNGHDDPMIADALGPAARHIHENLEVLTLTHPQDYRALQHHTIPPHPNQHQPSPHQATGFAAGTWTIVNSPASSPATGTTTGNTTTSSATIPLPGTARTLTVNPTSLDSTDSENATLDTTWEYLCEGSISPADLLALADDYSTWVLREVPAPESMTRNAIQRFAHMVDVLADADIPLHVYAPVPPEELARAPRGPVYPERMFSRLQLLTPVADTRP